MFKLFPSPPGTFLLSIKEKYMKDGLSEVSVPTGDFSFIYNVGRFFKCRWIVSVPTGDFSFIYVY